MTPQMIDSIKNGIFETLYMVVMSTTFAYIIGIPLGVALYLSLIHISEPTRRNQSSRMPSSA